MFEPSNTPGTFVFDMDGTLLNEHHELSPLTVRALQALRERGHQLVIATGRHFMDIQAYLTQLGGGIPTITCNGAMIHNAKGELIQRTCLPLAVNEILLPLGEALGVHLNIYTDSAWLVNAPCESMLAAHERSQFFYRQIGLQEMLGTSALKILFYGENTVLQQLKAHILQATPLPIHATFSDEYYLEVMPQHISKGDALKTLATHLQLPLTHSMAFGDGFNDVEMFNTVTHPVVMENASNRLKQLFPQAQRALSNHEDGVARFLFEHVLKVI
ncbi:MAG TPA: Cof-type HAD-IIB family hydrolase [Cellvibrio sp.]